MCVFKTVPCMNLGEREMPWEHESRAQYCDAKEKSNLFTLIIKMQIFFARAIIMSTARASSVFFFYRVLVEFYLYTNVNAVI